MTKLFISHAVHDAALAEKFAELLQLGVGIHHSNIFCSSVKGHSIKPGQDFVGSIREHLDASTCVVALISEAYYASAFCMCELGGVWLQAKDFLPILVPPVGYSDLKAVLGGKQVCKIHDEEDLDEVHDELERRLGLEESPATSRWTVKRDEFMNALPALLEKSKFQGPVQRAVHEKVEKQVKEYKAELKKKNEEVTGLKSLVEELRKAKDRTEVAAALDKHTGFSDRFKAAIAAAKAAMRPLPSVVVEALYYHARGEPYVPKREEDGIDSAEEDGYISIDRDDGTVYLDEDKESVAEAMTAIDALKALLEKAPADFRDAYKGKHGEPPELHRRPFWRRHLK